MVVKFENVTGEIFGTLIVILGTRRILRNLIMKCDQIIIGKTSEMHSGTLLRKKGASIAVMA